MDLKQFVGAVEAILNCVLNASSVYLVDYYRVSGYSPRTTADGLWEEFSGDKRKACAA